MGSIEDGPTLRRALDLALTSEIKQSELRYLFRAALEQRAGGATVYAWEKENWPKLLERVPGSYGAETLVGAARTLCAPAEHDDAKAFFAQATRGVEGVARKLDEALEKGATCIALRERGAANVSKYFGRK
jgi:hypothetical protein